MKQRSRDAYQQITNLLADLREALAGGDQSKLAEKHAQKLRKENPMISDN